MRNHPRCLRLVWFSLALVAALGLTAQGLRAQSDDAVPLKNWPAPLAWQATTAAEISIQHESGNREPQPLMTTTGGSALLATLVAITPCRIIDTRFGHDPGNLTGWPAGSTNTVNATTNYGESCGTSLPVALAYSANITVRMSYGGGTLGFLTVWPTGASMPSVSALNNIAGLLTVNNAAVIPAGTGGNAAQFNVFLSSNGTATKADVIVDINGYYISANSLQLGAGAAGTPSLTFGTDAMTGLYSTGTGNLAMAAGGANIANVNATGLSVNGNLDFSGAITQSGANLVQSNGDVNQSVAVGLTAHLSGVQNAAFGYGALGASSSGGVNVAVGPYAAYYNSGGSNIAVGYAALYKNTSGNNNVGVGVDALYGWSLGSPSSVGNDSTAVGYQALFNNQASQNTAVGSGALYSNMFGTSNTALGYHALNANINGNNTAVGWSALATATGGSNNTAVGASAGWDNGTGMPWTGFNNTFIGAVAGDSPVTGNDNTGIGAAAFGHLTSGHDNVAIGVEAGVNLSTGANDIYISNNGAEESNTIRIGVQGTQTVSYIAGIYGVNPGGSTQSVIINSSGQLGSISSSRRFKQDIRDLGETTDTLMALRAVRFRYKVNAPDGPENYGLVAEEVNEVAPELVGHDKDGQIDSVAYDKVYTMMLAELQKQHRVAELQEDLLQEQRRLLEAQAQTIRSLELRLSELEQKK